MANSTGRAATQGAALGAASTVAGKVAQVIMGDAAGAAGEAAGGAVVGAAGNIVQQGVSVVNSRNDESVITALFSRLKDDGGDDGGNTPFVTPVLTVRQKMKKWRLINEGLSKHQVSELRKVIVNLKLPERAEEFVHEEQIPVQSPQDVHNTQSNQQGKGNQTKNRVKKFTRVLKDYELINDPEAADQDYRIGMIELLLHMDEGPEEVTEAVAYAKQLIAEHSAIGKGVKFLNETGEGIYRFAAFLKLGDTYRDTMTIEEMIQALRRHQEEKRLLGDSDEELTKKHLRNTVKIAILTVGFLVGLVLIILTLFV